MFDGKGKLPSSIKSVSAGFFDHWRSSSVLVTWGLAHTGFPKRDDDRRIQKLTCTAWSEELLDSLCDFSN